LGLMSKPMVVTLPFVLLLLDYWPLGRMGGAEAGVRAGGRTVVRLVLEKWPFFLLSAGSCMITIIAQRASGALVPLAGRAPGIRLENALMAYVRYLGKLFWPTNLSVIYPVVPHWPVAEVAMAGTLVGALTVLAVVLRRRRPYLLTGWFWYLGTLVPAIGLVAVGGQSMADRYTYLPTIGILILVAWGAFDVMRRWRWLDAVVWGSAASSIVGCVLLARQNIGYWRDGRTLFRHAVSVTKANYAAHLSLGAALLARGEVAEALRELRAAAGLEPDVAAIHHNLGTALALNHRLDEAVLEFQEALRLNPQDAETHFNLGRTLERRGSLEAAILAYAAAVRWNPESASARIGLGRTLIQAGRPEEANPQLIVAVRLSPGDGEARFFLGKALEQQGQLDEAVRAFQAAIRCNPAQAAGYSGLADALAARGDLDEAIRQYQTALQLEPADDLTRNNLGIVLSRRGRAEDAIRQFQEALRLSPTNASARYNLEIMLGRPHP
jgi:protein O-mannosyl-transferase